MCSIQVLLLNTCKIQKTFLEWDIKFKAKQIYTSFMTIEICNTIVQLDIRDHPINKSISLTLPSFLPSSLPPSLLLSFPFFFFLPSFLLSFFLSLFSSSFLSSFSTKGHTPSLIRLGEPKLSPYSLELGYLWTLLEL